MLPANDDLEVSEVYADVVAHFDDVDCGSENPETDQNEPGEKSKAEPNDIATTSFGHRPRSGRSSCTSIILRYQN